MRWCAAPSMTTCSPRRLHSAATFPITCFASLLSRATEVVQQRLLSRARPETQAGIRRVLATTSPARCSTPRPARDFSEAQAQDTRARGSGSLGETELAEFAQSQSYDDTIAAMAESTEVPVDVVDRLMSGERPDPILILCKSAGYSWDSARAIILARPGAKGKAHRPSRTRAPISTSCRTRTPSA